MEETKIYRNTARLKDIDLFYLDTKSDKPAIVCLHGRWGRAETWHDFIHHYGQQYRIIAPDQRGHGLSGKPIAKYTAEEMAGDIAELLDYLKIDRAIIAGHSMGGRVAGHLAARYPTKVKALAILDKSASPSTKQVDALAGIDPLTKNWPMPFATAREAQDFLKKVTDSELEYQYFMNSLYETEEGYQLRFSAQAMAANIVNDADWYDLLPTIECPVLLIRAKGNNAVPDEDFAKMQAMLSNCMAFEASNTDHNVYLSNKEEFYGYFDAFLAKV